MAVVIDRKEYQKRWNEANKERLKVKSHAYYEANKEKIREASRLWVKNNAHTDRYKEMQKRWAKDNRENGRQKSQRWRQNHPEKVKLLNYRKYREPRRRFAIYASGAKKRGLMFLLSYEEFMKFWQAPCSYCGSEIQTIGLDRIDNSIGYLINNVTPCCQTCNRLKKGLSVELFLDQCRKIVNHSEERGDKNGDGNILYG